MQAVLELLLQQPIYEPAAHDALGIGTARRWRTNPIARKRQCTQTYWCRFTRGMPSNLSETTRNLKWDWEERGKNVIINVPSDAQVATEEWHGTRTDLDSLPAFHAAVSGMRCRVVDELELRGVERARHSFDNGSVNRPCRHLPASSRPHSHGSGGASGCGVGPTAHRTREAEQGSPTCSHALRFPDQLYESRFNRPNRRIKKRK